MRVFRWCFSFIVLLGGITIFAACGGSSSSNSNNATSDGNIVSGIASKGLIDGGNVEVYAILGDGTIGELLGTAITSSDGLFTVDAGDYSGAALVEVTGGSYIDEATAVLVDNVIMRAAIPDVLSSVSVAVTPLTELAVVKAEGMAGGLTFFNISSSNAFLSDLFAGVDIVNTLPADVLSEPTGSETQEQLEYGLMLAAISQMVDNDPSITDVAQLIDVMAADLVDGILDETAADLTYALTDFVVYSEYNATGVTSIDEMVIDNVVAEQAVYILDLNGIVTTHAGTYLQRGFIDSTGISARFNRPEGIVTDGTNIYVADRSNYAIRQIAIATGEVTTLAGGTYGSADGIGTAAKFGFPTGIALDGTNLYVTDTITQTIRQIVISTGEVTTLAGNEYLNGYDNGIGTAAYFANPYGIATDGTNLYVADSSNNAIRQVVIATGEVTTLAGSIPSTPGCLDGIGTMARFNYPLGITTDGINLYVTDNSNSTIRKVVISTGQVTTLAGKTGVTGSSDGIGSAASFYYPNGITTDGTNLYVADQYNHTIRKVVISTGEVTTLAGAAGLSGSLDGGGSEARFSSPAGITNDGRNLYVASNETIRKIE